MTNSKEKFLNEYNVFIALENAAKTSQEAVNDEKSQVKAQGVKVAEALYEAIIEKEIDLSFFENMAKPSRTAQGYLSKARKVGFAVLANTIAPLNPGDSVMTAYDKLQKALQVQKEAEKAISAKAAREMQALSLVCQGDMSEVSRLLTENTAELQSSLHTGLALIAEQEAKALAEEKTSDMARLVTETKANIDAIRAFPELWQEIVDYVNHNPQAQQNAA